MEDSSNGSVLVKKFSSRPRSFTVSPMAVTSRTPATTGVASANNIATMASRGRKKSFRVEPDHRRLEA
jgi:hypothetical protein